MNKSLRSPKRRGEWVELQFMARATGKGFTVSKPWGDSARYDFAVEHGGHFHRVQVKSISHCRQDDPSAYTCRVVRRYADGKGKPYGANEIDFFALFVIPEEVWYIVPVANAQRSRHSFHLKPYAANNRWFKFLEAWHLLRN